MTLFAHIEKRSHHETIAQNGGLFHRTITDPEAGEYSATELKKQRRIHRDSDVSIFGYETRCQEVPLTET